MKFLGLNFKGGNKAKVSLKKDVSVQFESCKNANIFKKLYSKLGTNLVKKLPITPNKFNIGTTKDCYTDISATHEVHAGTQQLPT